MKISQENTQASFSQCSLEPAFPETLTPNFNKLSLTDQEFKNNAL